MSYILYYNIFGKKIQKGEHTNNNCCSMIGPSMLVMGMYSFIKKRENSKARTSIICKHSSRWNISWHSAEQKVTSTS